MTQEFKFGDRVRGKKCGTRGYISTIHDKNELTITCYILNDEYRHIIDVKEIEHDTADLYVGDKVRKVSGYKFPGIVVAVFRNLKGEDRYVVECTVPEVTGMLHIYNRNQLEKVEG
jgi:hypothetical protein